MLGLPKSTEVLKPISKEKFYANMDIDRALEKLFISDIEKIIWQNKISTKTVNIESGKNVKEIDILEIRQKNENFNKKIIAFLDRNSPRHNVFVLTYNGKSKVLISYKEKIESRVSKFKVIKFYETEYREENILFELKGLDLDKVYDNFILKIDGGNIDTSKTKDIKEATEKELEKEKLLREIERMESKIRKEKQFNVQVELNGELRKLRERLENG